MKQPVPVRELFDCSRFELAVHLPGPDEPIWSKHEFRQRRFDVHADTRSVLLAWLMNWTPGRPPQVLSYADAPAPLIASANACAAALAHYLDGQVVRLMLAELRAGGAIPEHTDVAPALQAVHRCHVPIVTNDAVEFCLESVPYRLREGIAYEIDNTRAHSVTNRGATPRVHLICDVMPRLLAEPPFPHAAPPEPRTVR